MQSWYLIRTKSGAERVAQENLRGVVEQTLLPQARTRVRQQNRVVERVSPVFPSYLFALFPLASTARRIRYTPGVREIVRFGEQAAVVPDNVIEELTLRCAAGPLDFCRPAYAPGSPLEILSGPFREFRAVFEGYLNGTERVAVLLSVMNARRRVVMPAAMVATA
jgi:transcription antitermination factor NusG